MEVMVDVGGGVAEAAAWTEVWPTMKAVSKVVSLSTAGVQPASAAQDLVYHKWTSNSC